MTFVEQAVERIGTGAERVLEILQAVQGRFELRCYNVADVHPASAEADSRIIARLKEQFKLIGGPEALAAAAVAPREPAGDSSGPAQH